MLSHNIKLLLSSAGLRGRQHAAAAVILLLQSAWAYADFNREDYEEPAGSTSCIFLNPADGIYGLSVGDGTWIRNTPVFGDYTVSLFSNDIEDSWYTGAGMTFRIMPHWKAAPFAGIGASYNYSFKRRKENPLFYEENALNDRGDSYWGSHAEAGIRIWTEKKIRLLEICIRYTWSSLDGERDYWQVGISTGAGT